MDNDLPNTLLWHYFKAICQIPHPSGHEQALAKWLVKEAKAHGLAAETDAAGNVKIHRPAAPGLAHKPHVILQAHLDMVPQVAEGCTFDFLQDAIALKLDHDLLFSDCGTTLGADNGIGVAAALALLFAADGQYGPLTAVFTVSEEVGLDGAQALSSQFLAADYLLNLDSECDKEIIVGCAGGAQTSFAGTYQSESAPAGSLGVKFTVRNLAGGHSGINIHQRRGNALKLLTALLSEFPAFRLSQMQGGTLDNVIPREAFAFGFLPPDALDHGKVAAFQAAAAETFASPADFEVALEVVNFDGEVMPVDLQQTLLSTLLNCPNEVLEYETTEPVMVKSSSNLASVKLGGGNFLIRTSQRSLQAGQREFWTNEVIRNFAPLKAEVKIDNTYCPWTPHYENRLLKQSITCYHAVFGTAPEVKTIHAGLECGIIGAVNPKLEMISIGPDIHNPHSPAESVSIASVEKFFAFLQKILQTV